MTAGDYLLVVARWSWQLKPDPVYTQCPCNYQYFTTSHRPCVVSPLEYSSPLTLPAIRLHPPAEEPEGSVWDDPATLQSFPLAGPQGGQPPRASQRCFSPVWRLPSAGTKLYSRGDWPRHAETVWCHDGTIHSSTVPVNMFCVCTACCECVVYLCMQCLFHCFVRYDCIFVCFR